LLVVLAITSVLVATLLPALDRVQYSMRITKCMANTRQTTCAEIMYANDNRGRFADSLATIGRPRHGWVSHEPSTIVNTDYWPRDHRNQSKYLGEYLDKPGSVDCPEAPGRSRPLWEAWKAGDDWRPYHWLGGRKCFWRNFKGFAEDGSPVEGPKTTYERGGGKVLISCMLNYGRGRSKRLMSSSHFAGVRRESPMVSSIHVWPDFWIGHVADEELETTMQRTRLQAGHVDGHVESRNASDIMGVWAEVDENFVLKGEPGLRGKYFLPLGGLR
jgi:hypothetical protein